METTTSTPVRVLRHGTYNTQAEADRLRNQGKRPIVHGDGALVRFAEFHDSATGGTFHMSLGQSCIWDGVEEGDLVHLHLGVTIQEKAVPKADGSAFIDRKPKFQLLGVKPAGGEQGKSTTAAKTPATV